MDCNLPAGHLIQHAAVPAELDGVVRLDSATRAMVADDFGRMVHRTPAAVVRPRSIDDVAHTLRWANGLGCRVAPYGRGHSVWGRSQVDAGVVLDMTSLDGIHAVAPDRVTVDAGATWRDVLAATLPQGRTPPVLTDYLDLSVGGTLVVGGVGGTTPTFGMQCDNVLILLVHPDGNQLPLITILKEPTRDH